MREGASRGEATKGGECGEGGKVPRTRQSRGDLIYDLFYRLV